jgi:catechol 2,3-dioxygenase-like lactoylglutathione lyase family enzyme
MGPSARRPDRRHVGPSRPCRFDPVGISVNDTREEFRPGHYAFLVSDAEFDAAFARIRARGVRYYADPRRTKPGEINHLHGGRGVYFEDPNGHVMEIITHPYGDRPEQI